MKNITYQTLRRVFVIDESLFAIAKFPALLLLWACALRPAIASDAKDAASELKALDIGNQRQVFIDGRFLAKSERVKLVVHQPVKTNEFNIKADRPWEKEIGVYNSVLEENGAYHMWYETKKAICYATSKDGIHWEKPSLGLGDFKGDKQNNIVIGYGAAGITEFGEGGMVFLDPTAPPDQRFRMTLRQIEPPVVTPEAPPGVDVLSSPDGIRWRKTHTRVLTFKEPDVRQHLDTQNVIFWDDRLHKYVAYMRRNVRKGGPRFRTVVRSESSTIGNFEEAQKAAIVLGPDKHDARFGVPDLVDYYTSAAIKYPWAQDAYFMFPQVYFHYTNGQLTEFPKQVPSNAGPLDTQFAASRDGIEWQRYDREPFVRLGMNGSFDCRMARVFYGLAPSRDGREIYLYYLGSDQMHGWPEKEPETPEEPRPGVDPETVKRERLRGERNKTLLTAARLQPTLDVSVISRVVLRRDGFVSARADYTGGEFTTEPLKFSGRELVLNIDTAATGNLRCELLDANDRPIEGYSLKDSDVVHTANQVDRPVSWKGRKSLDSLAGKTVKLRFVLQSADLYAFQFR